MLPMVTIPGLLAEACFAVPVLTSIARQQPSCVATVTERVERMNPNQHNVGQAAILVRGTEKRSI